MILGLNDFRLEIIEHFNDQLIPCNFNIFYIKNWSKKFSFLVSLDALGIRNFTSSTYLSIGNFISRTELSITNKISNTYASTN